MMTGADPNPILKALAEEAEDDLAGTPSEPRICAGTSDRGQFLRFEFPYGICITVRPGEEKEFLLQVAWQNDDPERDLRMTPEGQYETETSRMGILGRLQEAAHCQNPAAILLSDRRQELRENAREKPLEDWGRWEKLVFAETLLDESLPNR